MEPIEQVHRLTEELERVDDPQARRLAEELAASVLELHREGLGRVFEALDGEARTRLAADGVVGSLLLIHGLHPEPIEKRVLEGLDRVRPYMESHGGDVELLGVVDGVARLRLMGSCDGCAASSSTLELAVERALEETAPDLLGMEVEGAVAQPSAAANGAPAVTGTALPMAPAGGQAPASLADWTALDGLGELAPGELCGVDVGAEHLVVANVDGSLLAYRDACAECGSSFKGSDLSEGVLPCPACGRRFFLPRAGRSLDDEQIQLEPVPMLGSRVALPA
jgi:Fe-S cluster biogenesis protein NfuA/nitrite reductase/ring-hydroxylating ferredoxin subunit